jgi:hypothetical protein
MAKVKKIVEAYPHEAGFRNQGGLKILRRRFGSTIAYTFWGIILELIIESPYLEWNFNQTSTEILADEIGFDPQDARELVEAAISLEMLEEDESGNISCPSLNEKLKYKKNREIVAKQPQEKFIPPALEVVASYFKERNNCTDQAAMHFATKFWNYYESKGWIVGKSPMKSWQSAVNGTWKPAGVESINLFPGATVIEMPKRKYLNI